MGLETADTIYALNEANPDGATDSRAEGDNHLRLIKDAVKKTFLKGLEANRPAAGTEGRYYIATDTRKHYYDNGASWDQIGPDPEPPGLLTPFAGAAAPSGYLLCDGSEASRTTFSDLFDVVGTTYGEGDGSTTFNLPDLRGRFVLGLDNMGGASADVVTDPEADSLGGVSGEEEHELTIDEMPTHNHTGTTQSAGNHNHTVDYAGNWSTNAPGNLAGTSASNNSTTNTRSTGSHTHTLNVEDRGGGEAHNNVPPFIAFNWVIKT